MNPRNSIARGTLIRAALLTAIVTTQAAEQVVDAPVTNITVNAGDSVWFDSLNTNTPIALSTINGATPTTGILPGWAHTRWTFLKYDGANVLEIPAAEKQLGAVNLANANATSVYYDNNAQTTFAANQSIGLVETTRDFVIENGVTLNVAQGGLLFHNNSHWMKSGAIPGFVTSSSGQLTVVTNGGQPDYQISGVVVKDFDATTPLRLVKTGPDHLNLTATNTYTGGTWINNGRLRGANTSAFGAAGTLVKVSGTNSQANLAAAGTFGQNFEIQGLGWTEAPGQLGALRFEGNATITGNVALTDLSRITANTGVTGTINGTLTGTAALEIGVAGGTNFSGTVALNGSAAGYTSFASVASGRLDVKNDFGGSVLVFDGAGLGGEGSIAGDVEIGGSNGSILIADGSTTDALAVAGEVDLSFGTTYLRVNGIPASSGTSFTAFTYGTLVGDPAQDIVVDSLRGGTASDNGSGSVIVNFTPGNITWTGAANENWTQNSDLNFDNGGPTNFFSGDQVSFTEAAPVKAITMVGMLYPSSVTFDNTSEYSLQGPNAGIGGSASITKNGTGTVILNGQANSFTGPVTVNEGVLKYGNFWEGLGYSSGITITDGGQVDFNGAAPVAVGRNYAWTIEGDGPDGLGAIINSSGVSLGENAGIRALTLSGDASIGGNGQRFDVGLVNGNDSTLTGNGHTLTKIGSNFMGFRSDASASPITFAIAGGSAWAENTDSAWGGASGTLRIKNGARGGTYGVRTIATPVFLEAGATLHNQGGGKGTWTGNLTLEGDATLQSGDGEIDVTGNVTGAFSLTKTGAQITYLANAQYSGNTTVTEGVLSLGAVNTNNDSSTVSISGPTGTKLGLPHGQTDNVASLLINGVPQAAGTYGSSTSDADFAFDDHFTGTGMLNVTSSGNAYQTWAALNGVGGIPGAVDSDGDGIPNAIEFVIGGIPIGPGSDSNGIKPEIDNTDPVYVDFIFRRTDESAGSNPYVQYGFDLTDWTIAEPGEPELNPVLIDETDDFFDEDVDRVIVRIPRVLAEGKKLFVRLAVDIP